MEHENNAQSIIDAIERLSVTGPVTVPAGAAPDGITPAIIAVQEGVKLTSLKGFIDELRQRPERREGTAVLESVESFCDYVNRFKNPNTAIFATEGDGEEPRLRGIIDHHEQGADGKACFGRHVAAYNFPMSEQWAAWRNADGVPMTQEQFAEFLEDRLLDVREPNEAGDSAARFSNDFAIRLATPAQLRDLSRGLSVRVNQHAAQKINTTTGETTLSFSEDHANDDGTPIAVPGGFVLGIPVFHAGDGYQLHARLRYRMSGRAVSWTVKLHRPDMVFRYAFNEAANKVAGQTECHVFRGHPEK
jgi:uncharacterized protein YfdQ (DUF2303 family)